MGGAEIPVDGSIHWLSMASFRLGGAEIPVMGPRQSRIPAKFCQS
jgi:hypothetical protein